MICAQEALARLIEGNRRYLSGTTGGRIPRTDLVSGQEPFAVILGCSDSRVPVEILFDADAGDLFVVRVAGNTAGPTQVASVEYAVEHLGTRLVLVLGHTGCGAVMAAVDQHLHPSADYTGSPVIDPILTAVREAASTPDQPCPEELLSRSVRRNVEAAVSGLLRESALMRELVTDDGLSVAGGLYSMETGEVDFFDRIR